MKNVMKVTMKDIAEKTGFTINTVSRALNNKDDISEQTKVLINNVANELGYISNNIAGSLRSGRTKTIALILGDISNPYFAIMVKEIEIQARKLNYSTFVLNTEGNYKIEELAIKTALSKKVDGIILCPTQDSDEDVRYLQKNHVPFVLFGRKYNNLETDYIVSDDVKGGYLATKHLIDCGHKNILMLNASTKISSAAGRLLGYEKAMREADIEIKHNLVKQVSVISGKCLKYMGSVVDSGMDFSAIFAFSDMMAWEAVYLLQSRGIQVPDDISIVGFDDVQSKLFFPVQLTTINSSKSKTALFTVKTLLDRINSDQYDKYIQKTIDTRLVIRQSTASR